MAHTADYKWDSSELLGKGAYGRVYKGVETESGREVAIKTFQLTLNCYIEREAQTMAKTNHENIIKFFGLQQQEDVICTQKVLVMEYCDGGNLQELIESKPSGFTSTEFLNVCQSLVSAVKHLRERDLVHRDIKPLNILISTRSDGQSIYKLADFGADRILKASDCFTSLYGTYEYIHPDIFAKYFAHALNIIPPRYWLNERHELWSLGVTLYEVATGNLPFEPTNGRSDPTKMYTMVTQKKADDISAKEMEGGKIEWSNKLPENCALEDSHLKNDITAFLAGLLQSTNEWSFEHFFEEATHILLRESTLMVKKGHRAQKSNPPQKSKPRQKSNPPNRSRKLCLPLRKKCRRTKLVGEIQWWRRQPHWYRQIR